MAPSAPSAPGSRITAPRERLLRLPEVEQRTGLKKSSIYAGMRSGTFPRCVTIGHRAVAWPESLIDTWIASRLSPPGVMQ
ncbi:helix-turn-helix transcriptional regulator [Methylibium rhizosphaerae]|uniref:helix-turn-helix transcriptional regulator n=1 Tax=Methylibium rhizosphaerae TaxID=2570323 RepID=UPI001C6124ED|nr:AlpA family transcriptional regulator [Methylibium rhizosphaerae]